MYKAAIISWLGGVLAFAQVAQAAESGKVVPSDSQRQLVIIGASYAEGWKQPGLPGYAVINKGVGGEETQQVRARFERDVLALKPQAVLIWGHINNIHRAPAGGMAATIERAKADYIDMISRARSGGIRVIVATEVTLSEAMGLRDRIAAFVGRLRGKQGYSARINAHVREINQWLRGYAQQQGLLLLDFEQAFDDGEGFRKREFTSEDGTHISASGYAALTRYAQSQLGRG